MDIKEKRILLADDEPIVTRTLRTFLTQAGFVHVHTVNNPLEIESRVEEFEPHVLLLDISMPELDGLKVLERLGDHVINDSLTVIMVTASEEEYVKRKALILGACDFISKPVDPEELVVRVTSALNGRPNREFLLNSLPPKSSTS